MEKTIEVSVREVDMKNYEKRIITEVCPEFLLKASCISTPINGVKNETIYYSYENYIPLKEYDCSLNIVFLILNKYVDCLIAARNILLNTENISSDVDKIFITEKMELRLVYGSSTVRNDIDKVCQIATHFSNRHDVVGAKSSMEMLKDKISDKNLGLKGCKKLIEVVQREWNHIN